MLIGESVKFFCSWVNYSIDFFWGGWGLSYNVCMKHEMGLQSKYFDYIKNGTKRIELRLFDEKRLWRLV